MVTLACGSCIDGSLVRVVPFVVYWGALFAIWAVVWGVVGNVIAVRSRSRLGMQPLAYALAIPALTFVLGLALFGLILPALLALALWLYRLASRPLLAEPGSRRAERVVAAMRRITLHLAGLLVPLGYVRAHGDRLGDVEPFATWLVVPPQAALAGSLVLGWALAGLVWTQWRRSVHADARESSSRASSPGGRPGRP